MDKKKEKNYQSAANVKTASLILIKFSCMIVVPMHDKLQGTLISMQVVKSV